MNVAPSTMPAVLASLVTINDTNTSLASCITARVNPPSVLPLPAQDQLTLMLQMTSNLETRLSNLTQSVPLSSWLTDPHGLSLIERLGNDDRMEVDSSAFLNPNKIEDAHLAEISDMMARAGPLMLDPVLYDYLQVPQGGHEEDKADDQMEETEHKRTKQGRQAGQKIQNIRKQDEECKDHR